MKRSINFISLFVILFGAFLLVLPQLASAEIVDTDETQSELSYGGNGQSVNQSFTINNRILNFLKNSAATKRAMTADELRDAIHSNAPKLEDTPRGRITFGQLVKKDYNYGLFVSDLKETVLESAKKDPIDKALAQANACYKGLLQMQNTCPSNRISETQVLFNSHNTKYDGKSCPWTYPVEISNEEMGQFNRVTFVSTSGRIYYRDTIKRPAVFKVPGSSDLTNLRRLIDAEMPKAVSAVRQARYNGSLTDDLRQTNEEYLGLVQEMCDASPGTPLHNLVNRTENVTDYQLNYSELLNLTEGQIQPTRTQETDALLGVGQSAQ